MNELNKMCLPCSLIFIYIFVGCNIVMVVIFPENIFFDLKFKCDFSNNCPYHYEFCFLKYANL